jgi:hypothetical protein
MKKDMHKHGKPTITNFKTQKEEIVRVNRHH